MSIDQKQKQIIADFSEFEDWMEKYEYIISLGKKLTSNDPNIRQKQYLISGCQSNVWLKCTPNQELLHFEADADALITKGVIALLLSVVEGQAAKDIAQANLHFVDDIGLASNLSPARANGLQAMIERIREYAERAGFEPA